MRGVSNSLVVEAAEELVTDESVGQRVCSREGTWEESGEEREVLHRVR